MYSWHSDTLKLYCHQWGLKVSRSEQELVARVFAASEMGITVQPTAEERIATTAIVRFGKWVFFARSFWLRESDAITSWPPIFLSDITVFLMEDHPGKDVALHKHVLNEFKEVKAYRL